LVQKTRAAKDLREKQQLQKDVAKLRARYRSDLDAKEEQEQCDKWEKKFAGKLRKREKEMLSRRAAIML